MKWINGWERNKKSRLIFFSFQDILNTVFIFRQRCSKSLSVQVFFWGFEFGLVERPDGIIRDFFNKIDLKIS